MCRLCSKSIRFLYFKDGWVLPPSTIAPSPAYSSKNSWNSSLILGQNNPMRGVFLTPFSFSKGSRYFWLKNIFCCVYLSTSTIFLSSRAFAGYFPMSVALLNPIFCLLQMKLKKAFAEKYRFSRYSKSFVSGNLIEKHDLSPHIN